MAYIAPNTDIHILKGIPFENDYQHTPFWEGSAQYNWFHSHRPSAKYTLSNYSYQRVKRDWLRVELSYEELMDCNYLMFRNTNYDANKWFYAFITDVEYINNLTSEIRYEIDVMQTWFFDYTLEECFIEREHQGTDVPGDNLLPEGLELGEYVVSEATDTMLCSDMKICVAATFDDQYNDFSGALYNHIFSGLCMNVFNTVTDAINFIQGAGAKADGIVAVFYVPTNFLPDGTGIPRSYDFTISKLNGSNNNDTIDGYVPKNNKLYTYPYNFLYATNLQGQSAVFPYEYFKNNNCQFKLYGDFTTTPSVVLVPNNYKMTGLNWDEKIMLSGYPTCSFNTDAFKAWYAQYKAGLPWRIASEGVGILSNYIGAKTRATKPWQGELAGVQAAGSAVSYALDQVAMVEEHRVMPHQAHGESSPTLLAAIERIEFEFFKKSIRAEFAQRIDDFFDMYGYACRRIKVPNRNVRAYWTYTKTVNCQIIANFAQADARKITNIYDNGITFWRQPNYIGDYSNSNVII